MTHSFQGRGPQGRNSDVAAACSLRCPSCPVGNIGKINPTGLIDKDLFRKIIEKADREYNIWQVSLFNWGEPSLHPCPSSINYTGSTAPYRVWCVDWTIYSALSQRYSASLFSDLLRRSTAQSHVRGNIERVKENMRLVAESRRRRWQQKPQC